MSQPNSPLIEYVAYSPGGKSAAPVHERFLLKEPLPTIGVVPCEDLSKPGFGLEVSPHVKLISSDDLFESYHNIFGDSKNDLL